MIASTSRYAYINTVHVFNYTSIIVCVYKKLMMYIFLVVILYMRIIHIYIHHIQFPLGQKVLCYVYDRYQDFSTHLLTTQPDDPLFVTYSANQYIAWKNLNSTCNWVSCLYPYTRLFTQTVCSDYACDYCSWYNYQENMLLCKSKKNFITYMQVQYKTNDSLPACTLTEIGKSCTKYRIYEHFNDIRALLDTHILQVNQENESGNEVGRLSIPDWLQTNLRPEPKSVSSVILTATGCTTNLNGEFIC